MLNFFKNLLGLPTAEEKAAAKAVNEEASDPWAPVDPKDRLPPVSLPIPDTTAKKTAKKPAKAKAKPAKANKPAKAKPAKAKKAK